MRRWNREWGAAAGAGERHDETAGRSRASGSAQDSLVHAVVNSRAQASTHARTGVNSATELIRSPSRTLTHTPLALSHTPLSYCHTLPSRTLERSPARR
eukprot:358607-Pleurochrysis_carterae.AAC.1